MREEPAMPRGDEPLTIRIDGALDIGVARGIVERLSQTPQDREVVIELGPGTRCNPVALARIAKATEGRLVPIPVRGLSGHDERILQYLGVDLPLGVKRPASR
jgi:hypothetical protein